MARKRNPTTGQLEPPDPIEVKAELLARPRALKPRVVQFRSPLFERVAVDLGGAFGWDHRPLSAHEVAVAGPVFGASIDYRVVRVLTSRVANAPTTPGNYIRTPPTNSYGKKYVLDDATLLHELTHVWQYQTLGTSYISSSVFAQCFSEGRDAAYVIHASQLYKVRSFYELSAERQARVVEIYYLSTRMRSSNYRQRWRACDTLTRLLENMTEPNDPEQREQFDAECKELDRLIAEVRRARPLQPGQLYEEAMHGLSANRNSTHDAELHIMPFFRIDF